jgi:succinyl-CoA synthetase beta subunit
LNIHEWQSKELLQNYGVTVQKFGMVKEASEAHGVAKALNAEELVVKAQVI